MAGRYPYSPYEVDSYQYQEPFGAAQSGPRRFFSAVGRFFYRLIVLTLIVGATGGALFALYRNDVLLTLARGAGFEAQYRSIEQRIGAPGWGTPRSIDVPAEANAPASATDDSKPVDAKQPETVQAGATKNSTPDGLPIVSFDSLPTAPAKGKAKPEPEPEALALSALPAAGRTQRAQPTRSARPEPAPRAVRATKVKLDEPAPAAETARSIPLPKAKPEPVAKAEPAPKPAPPAPKPEPEVDRTAPRANDNPLKAAIRASMAAKKSE
ncbi:MAG TPA: hypothetical protein VFZ53_13675 [Polyangiaceae bacterium]